MALEKLTGSATSTAKEPPKTATRTKSPTVPKAAGGAVAPSRPAANNAAATKEIEDLKTKLRVLEKKRIEDREKLNMLEKTKSERDRFERIIQTLQIKYQPQQQEIADLKRQLKEAESRFHNVEEMQQDHESALELATLDREMAEEMAEVYKTELDALKHKNEELELEVEILREEHEEFTKGIPAEERTTRGWLQLEKDNDRLREAVIRLRDMSREQEEEFRASIKAAEEDGKEVEALREQLQGCRDLLAERETNIEDLREQLDDALGAEGLIETLTEQTMNQSEQIKELQATILDLEDLKEISDELEINHVLHANEMQDEIYKRDAIIAEQMRQAAVQQKATEDMEYTLSRFRELVTSLQSDLADMRASHAVTENESEQLNNRSRAMLDLNMKLQISAAKAQVKTIDLELRRMDAQEAEQHLEIVTMFLPDTYKTDRDSVLALLRFKRLASKANIINGFIKERINGQPHPGHENELFEGCGAMDKLAWVSCMCDRFINSISHCSLEQFAKYEGALYELEPVERALNGWIENLKQDDLKEKECSAELQRTIALMTHLGEVHISNDLESFADDIHMKASLMQSYLESAAISFAAAATMVQQVVTQDEEELRQHFSKKTEAVVTQTRSAKVIAHKTVRALEDLKSRSLSLLPETLDAFDQCETATAELANMAQRIGLDLHEFLHEEGRTEPYTYSDVQNCAQKTATAAFGSDEADLFSTYLNKLRSVTSSISDLAALSVDLSQTQEFERNQAPWILRSQELKVLKTIPIEVEDEARRLKDDLANARRTLAMREEDLSTAQLKIETLESRMRDAKAKASRISELESQIETAKEQAATLSESIKKQDRELKSLELERDKWKQVASSSRVVAGGSAEGEAGTKANQERAVATAREIDNLRTAIDALQSTVRYLREENRRARMNEQPSYDWLTEPLTKNVPPTEQRKAMVATESRAVLGELVNLASGATVFDMASLPADKVAWKPAKSTPQYHAAKQMEDFGAWKGWQDAAMKKGKTVKGKTPARAGGESSGRKDMRPAGKMEIRVVGKKR
jgi:dynactin 1